MKRHLSNTAMEKSVSLFCDSISVSQIVEIKKYLERGKNHAKQESNNYDCGTYRSPQRFCIF